MSMATTRIAAVITALIFATACQNGTSNSAASTPSNTAVVEQAKSAAAPEMSAERTNEVGVPLNDHGNIVKQLGEVGGFMNDAETEWMLQFAVETITVDWPCDTSFAEPPQNGHFVRIDLWATTSPSYSAWLDGMVFAGQFGWIDSNGVTHEPQAVATTATFMCAEALPFSFFDLGDGQNYVGTVIIDVPTPTGSLTLIEYGSGGWEWTVG